MYFCSSILLLFICLLLFLHRYLKESYLFFENHGIPYIKPTLLFGNLTDVILLRKSLAEGYADLYNELKPHRFAGIFVGTKPVVLIRDPNLLKDILIKDYAYFSDRGLAVDPSIEPLSHHLFTMENDDWRSLRIKLTGAFTTGKMKMMFPLVEACGEKLSRVIEQTHYDESFDAKDLCAKYTTDVIGSCAFGLEINSLENTNSEFRTMGKKLIQFRFRSLLRILQLNIPKQLIRLLEITIFDTKTQNYFGDIILKTIEYRKNHDVKRNDFLDLLIDLKKDDKFAKFEDYVKNGGGDLRKFLTQIGSVEENKKPEIKLTDQMLAAQAFIFYFAGFETTSTNLSYVLLELSQNKLIQDKVRQEIIDVMAANNGQLTYDAMNQMTYMDMVIQETLRKNPPVGILLRRTVKNYKVPDSDVTLPAGTSIVVSVYGIHLDENYYDNPQEFRPERFTEEEKNKRPNYTYLPFGEGPRYCIGARFAKMTVKVGLIHMLRNFSYQLSPKMKFPIEFDKNFGLLTPHSSILLRRERI